MRPRRRRRLRHLLRLRTATILRRCRPSVLGLGTPTEWPDGHRRHPFTETVQLLNRQITFDIEPSEYTWTLGDGSTLNTTDPGRPWRQGVPMDEYLSHRYGRAGTVQLQLTTTWTARWRLPNGPWRPVDGTVETTTPPQQLEVTTARPQLISYD